MYGSREPLKPSLGDRTMAEAWGGLYFLIVVEKIPEISANIPKHLRNIAKNLQNPENVGKNPAISTKILQISRAVSRHLPSSVGCRAPAHSSSGSSRRSVRTAACLIGGPHAQRYWSHWEHSLRGRAKSSRRGAKQKVCVFVANIAGKSVKICQKSAKNLQKSAKIPRRRIESTSHPRVQREGQWPDHSNARRPHPHSCSSTTCRRTLQLLR